MARLMAMMFVGALLTGCSNSDEMLPTDVVRDADTAIQIGQKACSLGAQPGYLYPWHAKLDGTRWKVWSGPKYDGHYHMEITVSRAKGTTSDCEIYTG